jgi:signal transduction histidine kinase
MMAHVQTGQRVVLADGQVVIMPEFKEIEVRALESIYSEVVLNRVAQFTILAVGLLFLLSLIVGWVMSGRVLKPVEEITNVAMDIEASDLSRRIDLQGPDDELKRLANTFDGMLERLDRAFTSQRQFLADTSHDLRTPLAVIRSNVELVTDDPVAEIEDWQKAGGVIRRNAEKMSTMIDDLLASARLQAGKAQAVTLDLAEIVEDKAAEFESVAAEKGIALAGEAGHVLIQGVDVSLDRAMANLIDNAVMASPRGTTIRVGSGLTGGWAWLGVQDEGPGLPESGDRVGLGLSIVTQIAEGHGGALASFSGSDGAGTTMVIWLPAEESGDEPPEVSPFTND